MADPCTNANGFASHDSSVVSSSKFSTTLKPGVQEVWESMPLFKLKFTFYQRTGTITTET